MDILLSFRIPREFHREIKESAARNGIPLSQEIKNRLLLFEERTKENSLLERNQKILPCSPLDKESNSTSPYPLMVETVLLLRELILQRDSQILRKVDAELDQLFGADRRKIYEG
jgi:hypothetical protein